jgi:hypothetical protein
MVYKIKAKNTPLFFVIEKINHLVVPFGLFHMDFKLNCLTLASSGIILMPMSVIQECMKKTIIRSITKCTWCNG